MIEPEILNNTHFAEVALLGAILLDGAVALDVAGQMAPEDFALDSHQRIFRAMQTMARAGESIDALTLWDRLKRSGEADAIGGPGYLMDLTHGTPRNADIAHYAAMTRESASGRRAAKVFDRALVRLLDRDGSVTEILDDVSRQLTIERPDDTKTAAEVMPRALKRLEKGDHLIIPTGVSDLDLMLRGGFRTKELAIIGAQPSAGKSALCRQVERAGMEMFLGSASRLRTQTFGTHVFTIEVSDEQWMLKHAARLAGIHAWKLREPELMGAIDKGELTRAGEKIAKWPYRIDDTGGLTIDSLLAKARISAMRHNVKLITIDYLQLLMRETQPQKVRLEMSSMARRLKQFAKDYDCAVVALSQLTRGGDINKRPTVQDLKESGDIEAAADVVILNYRPKDTDAGTYTGEDELIVGKQRDGAVGALPQFFNSDTLCFEPRMA